MSADLDLSGVNPSRLRAVEIPPTPELLRLRALADEEDAYLRRAYGIDKPEQLGSVERFREATRGYLEDSFRAPCFRALVRWYQMHPSHTFIIEPEQA